MNIILMTPAMELGGMERCIVNLAEECIRRGHCVDIAVTERRGSWYDTLAAKGLPLCDLTIPPLRLPVLHMVRIAHYLKKKNADAVIFNYARLAQIAAGRIEKNFASLSVIHNDNAYVYSVAMINSRYTDTVIAISSRTFEIARSLDTEADIALIPNGVPVPAERDILRRVSFAVPLKLLYIGRLSQEQKGVLLLPKIIRMLVDMGVKAELTVAGEGPDESALRDAFEKEKLSGFYKMVPAVFDEKVIDLYLSHHILVMPSRYEGAPLVPLEAQASGCVPVASFLAGITDRCIENDVSGFLCDMDDPASFAEKIALLYNDPARLKHMSCSGITRIREIFSVEAMASAYLKKIDEIRQAGVCRSPQSWAGNLRLKDFVPPLLVRLLR